MFGVCNIVSMKYILFSHVNLFYLFQHIAWRHNEDNHWHLYIEELLPCFTVHIIYFVQICKHEFYWQDSSRPIVWI